MDDPAVDWEAFELVVVRSTWDYSRRRDEFVTWCARVGDRLRNPPEVIRWNTDKRYLTDLAQAGLPVVPTSFLEPGDDVGVLGTEGPCVVKPAVSAGARDTARHVRPGAAEAHARALLDEGRVAMVQPYVDGVDAAGETGLLLYEGIFDHAIRKGAMLLDGASAFEGTGAVEHIGAREPSDEERAVADAAVAYVTQRFGVAPLYARVDLLPAPEGPLLLELELTEPSLFFATAPGAAARYAEAVRRAAGRRASS